MKKAWIFILLVSAFFQCEPLSTTDCLTPATVRNLAGFDGCGWVFELNDGTRLEPYWQWGWCGTPPLPKEQTEDPLYNFEFVEGKKVLINYEEVNVVSTCMVGPNVKITCINEGNSFPEE